MQNEQEEAGAQAVMLAAQAGFLPERLEDAVVLVLAKVRTGMNAEEAVEAVAGANPAWTRGELPSRGGNPAKKRAVRKESPKVI